VLSIAARVRQ